MSINFTTGSMFDGQPDVLINTVNCVGVMGKGVALQFKKQYPEMFKYYQSYCQWGLLEPGDVLPWPTPTQLILNMATKQHWKYKSNFEWVNVGITNLIKYLEILPDAMTVHIPAVGCGNGGLSWDLVKSHLKKRLRYNGGDRLRIRIFNPMID